SSYAGSGTGSTETRYEGGGFGTFWSGKFCSHSVLWGDFRVEAFHTPGKRSRRANRRGQQPGAHGGAQGAKLGSSLRRVGDRDGVFGVGREIRRDEFAEAGGIENRCARTRYPSIPPESQNRNALP